MREMEILLYNGMIEFVKKVVDSRSVMVADDVPIVDCKEAFVAAQELVHNNGLNWCRYTRLIGPCSKGEYYLDFGSYTRFICLRFKN